MIFVGIILIAIGVGVFFYRKKIEDKLLDVKYYDLVDIKSAVDILQSVAKEVGAGHYAQMIKVNGKAFMEEPLQGEFTNDDCVYYEVSATHRFKRMVENKDQNGRVKKSWVPSSESIGSAEVGGEFQIIDNSGAVAIDIQGADLTIEQAFKEFKSGRRSRDFSFGSYLPENNYRIKSDGYEMVERHIKQNDDLFVIGELTDRNGFPQLTLSTEKDNPFIVSIHSEEQVIKALEGKIKLMNFISYACWIGGVVMAVLHFVA